jgi:hypothetical protein
MMLSEMTFSLQMGRTFRVNVLSYRFVLQCLFCSS